MKHLVACLGPIIVNGSSFYLNVGIDEMSYWIMFHITFLSPSFKFESLKYFKNCLYIKSVIFIKNGVTENYDHDKSTNYKYLAK